MAVNSEQSPSQLRQTFGQRAKQAGFFILFGVILVIPRIRRLRRRVWTWTFVRLSTAAVATWLGWRFTHAGAGVASLVLCISPVLLNQPYAANEGKNSRFFKLERIYCPGTTQVSAVHLTRGNSSLAIERGSKKG